ncbi:MAG: BON domain-containing protein [Alphaproteobacteria bacterium]|jgi:osmotically-inducible protein OsmY|nr:BON domain-containing protein [Alphaproteobacteria bacterium]MBT4711760.1 BON domain-containing protein [Alphaproteobacteria bacterium]MBT5860367.1 BON domain-containing protein [Alphaproteobacteria bacterium]
MIVVRPRKILTHSARAVLVASALVLGACQSLLVGGAAVVGVAAVQERSVGAALDDATIQVLINQKLFETDQNLFLRVGIEVVESRVLLTGSVTTPDARVAAVRAAWQVDGVREVLNEIQIAERDGVISYLNDARITGQLRFQMLTDTEVSDVNFSVDTVLGTVYLMGIALDQAELDRVTDYARAISGVENVISHVRLSSDPRR